MELVVTYNDHAIMYYPVCPARGWRIDNASRCLVIGKMPRTYVPLDQVRSFVVQRLPERPSLGDRTYEEIAREKQDDNR